MGQDPLKQRLEDVLPLEQAEKLLQVPADVPASIEAICTALQQQEGIDAVTMGRQVGPSLPTLQSLCSLKGIFLRHCCPVLLNTAVGIQL